MDSAPFARRIRLPVKSDPGQSPCSASCRFGGQRRFWISLAHKRSNPTSLISAIPFCRYSAAPSSYSSHGRVGCCSPGLLSRVCQCLPFPCRKWRRMSFYSFYSPLLFRMPASGYFSLRASELTWSFTSRCFETGRAPLHRKVINSAIECTPSFNIISARCVSTVRTVIPTASQFLICFPITNKGKSPVPGRSALLESSSAARDRLSTSRNPRSTMSDTSALRIIFPRDTLAPRGLVVGCIGFQDVASCPASRIRAPLSDSYMSESRSSSQGNRSKSSGRLQPSSFGSVTSIIST